MHFLKSKFILPISVIIMLFANGNILAESREKYIPCGIPVGIAVYNKGLVVTDIAEITDENGHVVSPAKAAGLKRGDIITQVNGKDAVSGIDITEAAETGNVTVCISRSGHFFQTDITPAKTSDGFKLGLWVRDSTAGIGTLTFYNPQTKKYAALGHAITDSDTGDIAKIRTGELYSCKITGVKKGERGTPGELDGEISSPVIGTVDKNTPSGISGTLSEPLPNQKALPLADISEVEKGVAQIYADIDGAGTKPYEISIERINEDINDGKNFVVRVTDHRLIEKTGGIVQGMSGSPIIQNNRIIGALTHVFVNNPEKGYGIAAKSMG